MANGGNNVLIDSGYPHSFIEHPPGPQGPLNLQVEMHPQDYVVNRLASIGFRTGDINYLICTHFDLDHAGNQELFSEAELVVQRRHYALARSGHPRFQIVREHWDNSFLKYPTALANVHMFR